MKEGIRSKIIDTDEHPRPDSTAEQLASLKPVFDAEGVVTAGKDTLVCTLLSWGRIRVVNSLNCVF